MGPAGHDSLALLAILGAGAGLLALAPLLRVPYPILLVLGGLALGFVPGIPHVALFGSVVRDASASPCAICLTRRSAVTLACASVRECPPMLP